MTRKTPANPQPSALKAKLTAARQSATVWFSAALPVLYAGAEALKEQLPALAGVLQGWSLVAITVATSAVLAALRVRGVKSPGTSHDEAP